MIIFKRVLSRDKTMNEMCDNIHKRFRVELTFQKCVFKDSYSKSQKKGQNAIDKRKCKSCFNADEPSMISSVRICRHGGRVQPPHGRRRVRPGGLGRCRKFAITFNAFLLFTLGLLTQFLPLGRFLPFDLKRTRPIPATGSAAIEYLLID